MIEKIKKSALDFTLWVCNPTFIKIIMYPIVLTLAFIAVYWACVLITEPFNWLLGWLR